MFLGKSLEYRKHVRTSKLGVNHEYTRTRTVYHLKCDHCGEEFTRNPKNMHHKRTSNNFFHVCKHCDAKRFAQKKGVEQKKIWDMPAGADLPISKY